MSKEHRKNNYLFYTPVELASYLVRMITKQDCERMIDICCGSWNLLRAAKKKYPSASIVGVDIDEAARAHQLDGSVFYHMDGREYALRCVEYNEKYDLVLSNPPFGYLDENGRMFHYSKNNNINHELLNKRYETEMIQANLLLLKPGGSVLFILPSTFVEGISSKKIRRILGEQYNVRALFCLPEKTFGVGRIRTWAVWMDATQPDDRDTDIYYVKDGNQNIATSVTKKICREKIVTGNWLGEGMIETTNSLDIYRGNLHSKELSDEGYKVLHCATAKDGGLWKPSIRYTKRNNGKTAKKGDIIINRIGKSAGYWCVNQEADIMISDCIIVIHDCGEQTRKLLEQNSDNFRLQVPIYGTTTQYITIEDIKRILR